MRRKMMAAGIALALAAPAAAHAQVTCEQRAQNRTAGTVVGGLVGALAGSAVASHGRKTEGAVLGGVVGAVVGNQVAKGPKDCQHAYGWYDNDNRWHANSAVNQETAWGYYDRRGEWIEGRPADYRPADYRPVPPLARDYDDRFDFLDGPGYPDFQRTEYRIRDRIRDGVRDNRLHRADARDLMDQLRDIREDELRMWRTYGARAPGDQRVRLRMRLRDLERLVGEARRAG